MDWLAGGDRAELAIERIYVAASESAAARGLDRLSVDEIAARVGCSRATLYRHVGGKKALRDGVLARAISRVGVLTSEAVNGLTGQDRVIVAILSALRAVRDDPVAASVTRGGPAVDRMMLDSPRLAAAAAELCGVDDSVAAEWIVRVVLSLLFWPMPDAATEESVVRRYVAAGVCLL
ncbi:AcrR family transcriptional regulator [Mycobacterium sp. MAA66]|uniref:TetR/AcrR family transcriptional regulator n=1 Tax=Mycobacterium sp. MAA66 TaxID=3156297 RepID=UPI0035149FD7